MNPKRYERPLKAAGFTTLLVFAALLIRTAFQERESSGLPDHEALKAITRDDLPGSHAGKVAPAISRLVEDEGGASPDERLRLVELDAGSLSQDDVSVLLAELLKPRHPNESVSWHSSYCHGIIGLLMGRQDATAPLSRILATLAYDRTNAPTLRDYAVQNLRVLWREHDDQHLRGAIKATFFSLAGADAAVAAPALMALHELRDDDGRGKAVDDGEIQPLVNHALAAGKGGRALPLRMTAVRIVGERNLPPGKQMLADIARDGTEHALARMAAIRALGKLDESGSMLSELALGGTPDPRLTRCLALTLADHAERRASE